MNREQEDKTGPVWGMDISGREEDIRKGFQEWGKVK
jgi:hypothetical protein